MKSQTLNKVVLGLFVTCGMGLTASFQAKAEEEKQRHCLNISQIDRIEVVDNQTLVFHMHGDTDYINHLPYRCHGLKNNALLHETSLNSYCDLDVISAIDTTIGMRLSSCPLGKFEPYVPLKGE